MILHAKRLWPEMMTAMLWPFACKTATNYRNLLSVNKDGKVAVSEWSGFDGPMELQHHHMWGCPVFILDSKPQSHGVKTPKWEPHSRMGICLGHSPVHVGSVSLALNPSMGHVSPQLHIVFDDNFTTCEVNKTDQLPDNWDDLYKQIRDLK